MSLDDDLGRTDRIADRMTGGAEKLLIEAFQQSLKQIRARLALLYEKHGKAGKLELADVARYNRLTNLETDIAKELSALGGKEVRITRKHLAGVYQETYYRVGFALEREVQAKLRFGLLPVKQVQAAVLNPLDRIGWPDRTKEQAAVAIRQVREEVTRGIIQGQDYGTTARAVKERLDMAASRAIRIVQTESHRAREEGKLAGFEQAASEGVEMVRIWDATLDPDTRPAHQAADGQEVGMDEPFVVGGERLMYPGDPAGSAGNVINCRCAQRVQVKGYEPRLRRVRGEGVIPYKTYDEWAKEKGIKPVYRGPEPRLPGAATTVQAAEEYARKAFGLERVDYGGMTVDIANGVNQQIEKTFQHYPELKGFLKDVEMKSLQAGRTAEAAHYSIALNRRTFADMSRLERSNSFGFHSTANPFAVLSHEMGHTMDWFFAKRGLYGPSLKSPYYSATLRKAALANSGLRVKDIGRELSIYATRNPQEFFAEAFAELVESPSPRPLAAAVGKELEAVLSKIRGK